MRVEFRIPSRALFGYRSEFLSVTRGEGVMNTIFDGYDAYKGDLPTRTSGSLISFDTGTAVTYGLYNAQERGTLFIGAGEEVYEGMDRLRLPVCGSLMSSSRTRPEGASASETLFLARAGVIFSLV